MSDQLSRPEPTKELEPAPVEGGPEADVVANALRGLRGRTLEVFGDTDDEFVVALRGIKDSLDIPDDATVLYPGSSTHAGVARAFGKERVVHIDPDHAAVTALEAQGYKAVEQEVEEYHPDAPADVMVALNSYGTPTDEVVRRLVKPGGFIVANNYTQWAHELGKLNESVRLKAALMPSYMSPDAELVNAGQVPPDSTDVVTSYLKMDSSGTMSPGTPEDHTFANQEPKFPDALFVFERR